MSYFARTVAAGSASGSGRPRIASRRSSASRRARRCAGAIRSRGSRAIPRIPSALPATGGAGSASAPSRSLPPSLSSTRNRSGNPEGHATTTVPSAIAPAPGGGGSTTTLSAWRTRGPHPVAGVEQLDAPPPAHQHAQQRRCREGGRVGDDQGRERCPEGSHGVRRPGPWAREWCRRSGSNRHEPCGPRDFESRASANFATPAAALILYGLQADAVSRPSWTYICRERFPGGRDRGWRSSRGDGGGAASRR